MSLESSSSCCVMGFALRIFSKVPMPSANGRGGKKRTGG